MSEFIKQRNKIRQLLVSKKQMSELARRAHVSRRTVDYTFEKESLELIKGKQLSVWNEALKIASEITSMAGRTKEASDGI